MSPGSMPVAREIYQEGFDHPARAARVGAAEIVADVMALLLANVRTPEEREGDLTAQMAANRVGETRLRESVTRYGRRASAVTRAALQDYTERVMRAAIAAIPDGRYSFEDALDDDGFADAPVRIRVDGSRIAGRARDVDFTGSRSAGGGQRERGLRRSRCRRVSTRSAVSSATTCSTTPASRVRSRDRARGLGRQRAASGGRGGRQRRDLAAHHRRRARARSAAPSRRACPRPARAR